MCNNTFSLYIPVTDADSLRLCAHELLEYGVVCSTRARALQQLRAEADEQPTAIVEIRLPQRLRKPFVTTPGNYPALLTSDWGKKKDDLWYVRAGGSSRILREATVLIEIIELNGTRLEIGEKDGAFRLYAPIRMKDGAEVLSCRALPEDCRLFSTRQEAMSVIEHDWMHEDGEALSSYGILEVVLDPLTQVSMVTNGSQKARLSRDDATRTWHFTARGAEELKCCGRFLLEVLQDRSDDTSRDEPEAMELVGAGCRQAG